MLVLGTPLASRARAGRGVLVDAMHAGAVAYPHCPSAASRPEAGESVFHYQTVVLESARLSCPQ